MTTLVIGANGQIGKQFCELAKQSGTPIRAMIRSEEQAAWFQERDIQTVLGDLEGEFEHAFEGCDQVVFTAGSGPHTGPDKTLMIDLFGAIRTADIASQRGLSRYIMVSAMRAEQPLEAPEKMRPYMAAKFAADAHLRHSDVSYVILKPGRLTDDAPTISLPVPSKKRGITKSLGPTWPMHCYVWCKPLAHQSRSHAA